MKILIMGGAGMIGQKLLNLILSNPKLRNKQITEITLFDIIDEDDFVIKYNNGSYSYERIIPDGTVRKPLEELIQKNINKLFENLLQ